MSKGTNCVIIYSIVLVILFIVFCYLMTLVNPKPIKVERSDDGLTEAEVKLENIIFDEVLLPSVDNALYGLEKTYSESSGTQVPTKPNRRMPIIIRNSSALFNFTTQRVRPPIWAHITHSINNKKRLKDYTNSIVTRTPSTTKSSTTVTSTILENITDETESTEMTEVTESSTITTETPMKGRRRSIKDFGGHTNESVILHITDDRGELKIEIKLGSNSLLKRNNEDEKHETKSKFSIGIEKNNGEPLTISKLARNSAIEVLPNNTVIIDEFEDVKLSNENDIQNSTDYDMTRTPLDVIVEQVTDYRNTVLKAQNEITKTEATLYAEVYALKVLFDNETKSITNTIHDDVFHKTTIKDMPIIDSMNYTELYGNNTEVYDVNNNSVSLEKPYNYQDFITVS